MSTQPAHYLHEALALEADRAQAQYFRTELHGHITALSQQIAAYERSLQHYRTRIEAHQIRTTENLLRTSRADLASLQRMVDSLDARFATG